MKQDQAGRIAEDIGCALVKNGHGSYIAYPRNDRSAISSTYNIGSRLTIV